MRITDNTVFIPGATSGIGLALARRLRDRSNTVVVGGRRADRFDDLRAEGFDTVRIDTADPDSIRIASAEVVEAHPDLNVLIAMAGIMESEDWHAADTFLATAERAIETNLLGPIRLIAALTDQLQSQDRSTIVTVSSGLASVPLAATATYCATKAAIHSLSQSIRTQLSDTSVQVVELVPPAVATTLMGNDRNPRAMDLDDFADQALELLAGEPDAHEILVERVEFQRFAERRGDYDHAYAVINGLVRPETSPSVRGPRAGDARGAA